MHVGGRREAGEQLGSERQYLTEKRREERASSERRRRGIRVHVLRRSRREGEGVREREEEGERES